MITTESNTTTNLLTFYISSYPNPMTVSPNPETPSLASLLIQVFKSKSAATVYCSEITFGFSIGPEKENLATNSVGINVQSSSDEWEFVQSDEGTYRASPKASQNKEIPDGGISFQIFGIQVNPFVGKCNLTVNAVTSFSASETAKTTSKEKAKILTETKTLQVTKYPYGFYFDNFEASSPAVQNGNDVTLTWNGSLHADYTLVSTCQIKSLINSSPENGLYCYDVTNLRSVTTNNLTETTTFCLKATATIDGESVVQKKYVTVQVLDPNIYATSINSESLNICNGALSVNYAQVMSSLPFYLNSNLSVDGKTELQGAARLFNIQLFNLELGQKYRCSSDGLLFFFPYESDKILYEELHFDDSWLLKLFPRSNSTIPISANTSFIVPTLEDTISYAKTLWISLGIDNNILPQKVKKTVNP